MIRAAVLGMVLLGLAAGAPDKAPASGYIKVEPQPSYGAPPAPTYGAPKAAACYPKQVTKVMTKDVQGTSNYYATVTQQVPTTNYAYITETKVAPKTIILYSTMTAYAEPNILTETKVLYDTKMVTVPVYMTESKYGYNTASAYFTETIGTYVTKVETQSYPMTNVVTNTNYNTEYYDVTHTKVQQHYVTMTVKNPYYVTNYETQVVEEVAYQTMYQTENQYVTMTVYNTVPEYHTVTQKCSTSMMYGYGY